MDQAPRLTFSSPPSLLPLYARAFLSRKPAVIPPGTLVPRIEGFARSFVLKKRHVEAYRKVCGIADSGTLPITYPQLLVNRLQFPLLLTPAFPIRLTGLVHLRNVIEQLRPLTLDDRGGLHAWLEGHRETERGQEIDIYGEVVVDGLAVWRACSTVLVRDRAAAAVRPRPSGTAAGEGRGESAIESAELTADERLGWRYARVSGDFNPIHLFRAAARAFGFPRAIAHGMWSLAACAARLEREYTAGPSVLAVSFTSPVLLPAALRFERWQTDSGSAFRLRDAQRGRIHLAGSLQPLVEARTARVVTAGTAPAR